jgi:hypothetical protein
MIHGGPAPSDEVREQKWVPLREVEAALTFPNTRAFFHAATPTIAALARVEAPSQPGFPDLLVAEFEHTGEALLRNEEDGEKRVTFLISISGGVLAVLGFLLGSDKILDPGEPQPLVVFALAILCGLGLLTLTRVVARNVTSDRYKRGLNAIRRYFVPVTDDPRVSYLPFNPFRSANRERTWGVGKGGWLPTVVFVNAVLLGALGGMLAGYLRWEQIGASGAAVAAVEWFLLMALAHLLYKKFSSD